MWAVWALVSFAGALTAHAGLCRSQLPMSGAAKFAVAGVVFGLALGWQLAPRYGSALETWAGLLLFAFACELYVFLFTFVGSSVSVSLLLQLRKGGLAQPEIDRDYASEEMVARRLKRLVSGGFLSAAPSGYLATSKGRLVLLVFDALGRFFRHPGKIPGESATGRDRGDLNPRSAAPVEHADGPCL
jgi:hypothetical protein